MKLQSLPILLAAVAVAVAVFVYYRQNDRLIIQRRFHTIMDSVSKQEGEGNLSLAAKHQTLLHLLHDHVAIFSVDPPIDETFSAQEIMSHYVTLRRYCRYLKLNVSKIDITLTDETHALLTCYGNARFETTSHHLFDESRAANVTFIKQDDTWLLESVKEPQVFK